MRRTTSSSSSSNSPACSPGEGDDKPATPRRLKDAIARRSSQFAGFAQQDAHEFLADCLEGLQEEMAELSASLRDAVNSAARRANTMPPLHAIAVRLIERDVAMEATEPIA